IQNSVDAIDEYSSNCKSYTDYTGHIDISADRNDKSIKIVDNGSGIPITRSWHSLHDLGRSAKDNQRHRGFRGIGRLGGLGYCDELVFTTKAEGESVVSKNVWDCVKIRSLINNGAGSSSISSIIEQSVTFNEDIYTGDTCDHFFSVELNNIRSKRGLLLNVPAIKNYISQVAPVPFNTESFSFANTIEKALREIVPSYETYNIRVNGEQIYKSYTDKIGIRDSGSDNIDNIRLFQLADDHNLLAFGWLGEHNFLGMILPSTLADGIRLRAGNILIGDKDTLSEFYREKRFNCYMVGEIHIVDKRLIPNSRRDNFEDTDIRDSFHSCFIRDIGIPYSKKIRELSAKRSAERRLEDAVSLCNRAKDTIKWGYIAEKQKNDIIGKLEKMNGEKPDEWSDEDMENLVNNLRHSNHILDNHNGTLTSTDILDLLKSVLDAIYLEAENKARIENLIKKILPKSL
ncbi:ATP-binding protein, partial [Chloroflexota bacterium]